MSGEPETIAVVSAGWSPKEDDPLAEYTQGKAKALIPIANKPMIAHIVDALVNSTTVKHIIIVALDPDTEVQFPVPIEYVSDAGSILANAEAGLQYAANRYPDVDAVLLCTSDIPTITGPIVDALVEECLRTDHDLYYTVIERSVMEKRFPGSHRSYRYPGDCRSRILRYFKCGNRKGLLSECRAWMGIVKLYRHNCSGKIFGGSQFR